MDEPDHIVPVTLVHGNPWVAVSSELLDQFRNREISIEDLAALIKEKTGSASEIVYIPYDEAYQEGFEDMRRRVPDIAKAKGLIGFEPSMDIEGIVDSVIAYYRS